MPSIRSASPPHAAHSGQVYSRNLGSRLPLRICRDEEGLAEGETTKKKETTHLVVKPCIVLHPLLLLDRVNLIPFPPFFLERGVPAKRKRSIHSFFLPFRSD
jgi:hypothetical protein